MTDASPSQTEPAEPDGGAEQAPKGGSGHGTKAAGPQAPRWSEQQPEPAPWFVGRPGAAPPQQAGWGVSTPPPYQSSPQSSQPPQQPGADAPAEPAGPAADQGSDSDSSSQAPRQGTANGSSVDVRDSAGQPTEGPSGAPADSGAEKPAATTPPQTPPTPPQPPQNPYGQPGPYGAPPPQVPPWQDPNRYGSPQRPGQPGQQQNDPWQRQQRPPRQPAGPPEPRGPLDLRTRWSRGLALGAVFCTLAAIWYSISDFPTWLVGAGVGLVLGLVGLWLGVFAQRAAMAKGKRAPEAVGAIVWSSIASLLSLMIIAFSLLFYTQLSQLSNCTRSATTIAAQNQCETTFENQFGGTR